MYNYYQQQNGTKPIGTPTYAPPPPPFLKGHPVSSLEEVRATSIDFDGSIFYFPDIANKRIYTKTVDMNKNKSFQVNFNSQQLKLINDGLCIKWTSMVGPHSPTYFSIFAFTYWRFHAWLL